MTEDTQDQDDDIPYDFAAWVDNPASPYADHNVPDDLRRQVANIEDAEQRKHHIEAIREYEDGKKNPREFARIMVESPYVDAFDPFDPHKPKGSTVEVTVERSAVDGISYEARVDMPEDVEEAKDAYRHDPVFRTFVDTYAKDRPTDDPDTFFDRHAGTTVAVDAIRMGYDRRTLQRQTDDEEQSRQTPIQADEARRRFRRPNIPPTVKKALYAFMLGACAAVAVEVTLYFVA